MHQAQVNAWGEAPRYVSVPAPPTPGQDEIQLKVLASGLHRLVRARASGKHYTGASLPHVPGVDGVGLSEADGKTYYFFSFNVGTMAEYVNVPKASAIPLPEGVDPVQAAGIMNPALSSWMAFNSRVVDLPKDFTVLIIGATSASGRVAISLAKSLGAKRVIGAARNKATLEKLGLEDSIVIADQVDQTDFSTLGHVDVILDYVTGALATHLLMSIKTTKRVQYVHIGAVSGETSLALPAAVLRSKNLSIIGAGAGAWSTQEMVAALPDQVAALKDVPEQPMRVARLADVEQEWLSEGVERVVFVP